LCVADFATRNGYLSSSVASSGFHSNQSEQSNPSPPSMSHLSESAPASTSMFSSYQQDEGVDVGEEKPDGTDGGSLKQVSLGLNSCITPV